MIISEIRVFEETYTAHIRPSLNIDFEIMHE